jgi:hypothetical protein
MSPIEAALVGALISGVLSISGVVISGLFQSKGSTFTTLVQAYEAVTTENARLRAESLRKDQRITDLEGQVARAYGQWEPPPVRRGPPDGEAR